MEEKKKILIVEDERAIVEILKFNLAREGYETLEALDLATVESAGYSFQLEMNHRAWKRGFAIKEIPIVFTDRVAGCSKITAGIALESIRIALRLRFRS